VWVLDADDHPRPVSIRTGIADDRYTEVTDGLREGERVIVALRRETAAAPQGRPPSFGPARRGH
jgi:multidrug efflux pump subunit AcrA (membrane-fusion protein)